MTYQWHNAKNDEVLNAVLDEVSQWQADGRDKTAPPALRDALLDALEELADERRRDNCDVCNGNGVVNDGYEDWTCQHCLPLREA